MNVRFCDKCGTKLAEGAAFCDHCGAKIYRGESQPAARAEVARKAEQEAAAKAAAARQAEKEAAARAEAARILAEREAVAQAEAERVRAEKEAAARAVAAKKAEQELEARLKAKRLAERQSQKEIQKQAKKNAAAAKVKEPARGLPLWGSIVLAACVLLAAGAAVWAFWGKSVKPAASLFNALRPTAELVEPTVRPTEQPTPQPTEAPTPQPTEQPAPQPTLDITAAVEQGFVINQMGILTEYTGPGGEVHIPVGVTEVYDDAFRDNREITAVYIPEGVTRVGHQAFSACTSLENIEFPSTLTELGYQVFWRVPWFAAQRDEWLIVGDGLLLQYNGTDKEPVVPESVKHIGGEAFVGNQRISGVTLHEGVMDIGDRAFEGCTGLRGIAIPGSVQSIGSMAFVNCPELKSVTIGEGVLTIEDRAFSGAMKLESIVIPGSVVRMGLDVFKHVTGSVTIYAPADSRAYHYCNDYDIKYGGEQP